MNKRKKRTKIQQEKRRILLDTILDKWVCFKQSANDEERYIYVKHTLRDGKSYSKVEQIVLSSDPMETGVYYITDYEIDRVLDMTKNSEVIELTPVRYDMEIGMFSSKHKLENKEELFNLLIENNYVTREEIEMYTKENHSNKNLEEVYLSFVV